MLITEAIDYKLSGKRVYRAFSDSLAKSILLMNLRLPERVLYFQTAA